MISSPFSSEGRIRRWHYFISGMVLNGLISGLGYKIDQPNSSPLLVLFMAPLLWVSVTLMVQRAHDADRNGKFVALTLGLLLGSFLALSLGREFAVEGQDLSFPWLVGFAFFGTMFLCGFAMAWIVALSPGNPDSNNYGPNPRRIVAGSAHSSIPGEPETELVDLAARRGFQTGD